MTIRHLKIFIAVAETGCMSKSAKMLYLSQPTVSQAIHDLEKHYDMKLFERLSKRLYITEGGKQLLDMARDVVRSFDEMELRMRDESKKEHLRLGVTLTVGTCLLPSLLNDLQAQRPQTETFSFIGNTRNIEAKLLKSELDAGIVEGIIKSPDLVSLPMVDDFLVLVCGADHPFAKRDFVSPSDLEGMDFVMREEGSGTRALFEDYLRANQIRIRCKILASCADAVKNAILHNQCMGAISVRLIEEELKNGAIRILATKENAWPRTFNLVYHKDKPVSASILLLKELLEAYPTPALNVRAG